MLFGENRSYHRWANALNELVQNINYSHYVGLQFYPVKMSMEVSFTTHSHIIGRTGANINTVMKETMTKIHFPDQNRVVGEKKSNEVTISGELINVETARRRIRVCKILSLNQHVRVHFRLVVDLYIL